MEFPFGWFGITLGTGGAHFGGTWKSGLGSVSGPWPVHSGIALLLFPGVLN